MSVMRRLDPNEVDQTNGAECLVHGIGFASSNSSLRCPCSKKLQNAHLGASQMKINYAAVSLVFITSALLPLRTHAQTVPAASQAPNSVRPETADPFRVTVQVTATRFGEPIQEVPGAISVVTGEELRARGVTDLRTALALLGGVSVA